MARTYLFFHPARLPLEADELDESTVTSLFDTPALRTSLEAAFPGVKWSPDGIGHAQFEGHRYELWLPVTDDRTLSMRCTLRADHSALVQSLCDRFGWLAFDEEPLCFQPHRPPMPA